MGEEMHIISKFEDLETSEQIRYSPIQEVVDTLERYVNHRIETGSFVRAVLENDFMGAFRCADIFNTRNMALVASYVYNYVPMSSKGSPETVSRWLKGKK